MNFVFDGGFQKGLAVIQTHVFTKEYDSVSGKKNLQIISCGGLTARSGRTDYNLPACCADHFIPPNRKFHANIDVDSSCPPFA
ncbi:MAG: hypothetical protein P8J27_06740 [Mariniblastus sp.]|nr:hypothetical protein [Mariniblastus sp.]